MIHGCSPSHTSIVSAIDPEHQHLVHRFQSLPAVIFTQHLEPKLEFIIACVFAVYHQLSQNATTVHPNHHPSLHYPTAISQAKLFAQRRMPTKKCESASIRDWFIGNPLKLIEVLVKVGRIEGPRICSYADEGDQCSKAKLIHGECGVQGAHALLAELYEVQPNLSFARRTLQYALKQTLDTLNGEPGWNLSPPECLDWVETHQKRIRNLCRVVSQGQYKVRKVSWVKALPWMCGEQLVKPATRSK